ncbi:hypothetical protein [Devosia sp.]|uniref:hypothetical protein n=1 Tax=Devosia sp. TaxID=1871048 RepID=UPI001ACF9AD0|nr:hypothetical protein [Devosia sp.]MBN9308125.1 hypothetical protein [Devosia sp.]
MAAVAAPTDTRERLYRGLMRRNRIVAVLRWVVPAAGAAVLAVVIGAMALDSLAHRFGFANIRIDRDNLVVETPQLTSTGQDGTVFSVTAQSARVSVTQRDIIDMAEARLTMAPSKGATVTATAAAAQFQTSNQLLSVPGTTRVQGTDGLAGTVDGIFADLMQWTMTASGKVHLSMPDGATLDAGGMSYDHKTRLYSFKDVTVNLTMTPGEGK